ncbi:MAG: ABC transporter substrate-binding protein [Ruminococcaceae bacterium]|nr:ABC transporter substrate-binding protein [Oscillospiraceae bacterium]
MWKKSCCKLIGAILALLCLVTPLASCGTEKKAGSVADPASFTDALGRMLSLEKKPKRVAALLGSFADLWILSGGTVCAVTDDAEEDFGIDTKGMTLIGGAHSPSLEKLLSADPDFVLASASTPSHVDMKESLEQAGITVAYFDVSSFDEYLSMLKICTDLTGKTENYKTYGTDLQGEIEEIKASFTKENLSKKDKTVLVLRISSGLVKAKGSKGTILGEMLSDLGCINLADSESTLTEDLNIEYILKQNPRYILLVTMGDETKAKANFNTMMEENPAWSSLDAIREGRMHILDKSLFNQKPNARWAIAYETLAKILAS